MAEQTVPIMKLAVVGRYRDDTTYLLKQLEEWCARRPVQTKVPDAATPERGDTIMLVNDFGPRLGAPRYWSIEGSKRRYQVWECVEGFQSLIARSERDVSTAVVMLSASESMTPATREFLQILRVLQCNNVIVYVSNAAAVIERQMLDLVELEAREALSDLGFQGDLCTVLFEHEDDREAQTVVVTQLTDALDAIALPNENPTEPFVVSILDVFAIRQRGLVCAVTIHRGVVELNAAARVVSLVAERDCRVGAIEIPRSSRWLGSDQISVILKDLDGYTPVRGELITAPDTTRLVKSVQMKVLAFSGSRGDQRPFLEYGFTMPFALGLGSYVVPFEFATEVEGPRADGLHTVVATLQDRSPLVLGLRHRVIVDEQTVGLAFVTEVLD